MSSDATGIFINETHTSAAIWQYRVEKMILEGKTEFQTYQIAEISRFGKSLFLDYNIQTSLLDEHVFHECMSCPALTLHPHPKRVVVCGGGEGATLREVLKHGTVEEVIMVDIDRELVDMVKVHMAEWHQGAFLDPRTTLIHTDARQWLKDHRGANFDVIISDLPNPHQDGPAQYLFTKEYFQICADAISDDGVFAMQAGSANANYPGCMVSCIETLESMKETFSCVAGYSAMVTTFFQPWGFVLASKKYDLTSLNQEIIEKRFNERGVKNRYYTPRYHQAIFTLPDYLIEAQKLEGQILTDASPYSWTA